MVRIIRHWTLGVFAVVFILGACMMYWRTGEVEFGLLSAIATLAAVLMGVRFYFILKPEFARLAAEHKRDEERLFNEACGEVAVAMSHLSIADFSVFITCKHYLDKGEDGYGFLTGRGSPVHNVLVAMSDVRCARPKAMKPIMPGSDYSSAHYELTELGVHLMPRFLEEAARHRRLRSQASA